MHDVLDLELQLLLGPQQPLPDLIADDAPRQQRTQRLFARSDLNDAADVLLGAGEEGGAEDRIWHFRGLFAAAVIGEVEKREVDVALCMVGEVGC